MLRVATPLLVLVLLGGCLGGDEPGTPAAAQAPATTRGADATATLDEASNATDAPAPLLTPVAYAGASPVGVCQFIAGQCAVLVAGSEDYHMLEPVGRAQRLALQVTYSGQVPGMDFYVGVCIGENEGTECLEYKTGPSPLAVEYDLSSYPPGTSFGISVGSVNTPAAQTATMVFGPADFEVAGTLTSLPVA